MKNLKSYLQEQNILSERVISPNFFVDIDVYMVEKDTHYSLDTHYYVVIYSSADSESYVGTLMFKLLGDSYHPFFDKFQWLHEKKMARGRKIKSISKVADLKIHFPPRSKGKKEDIYALHPRMSIYTDTSDPYYPMPRFVLDREHLS